MSHIKNSVQLRNLIFQYNTNDKIMRAVNRLCKLVIFTVGLMNVWPINDNRMSWHSTGTEAATVTPQLLPSVFMTDETLSKLRNTICKRCAAFKQKICSDFSSKDVCHLLCGCNNYSNKCLAAGDCACPLPRDEGCRRGSVAVCEFDDAMVCSTSKNVCLLYDETRIHCECLEGWTGVNCQTCDQQISDCSVVDDKSGGSADSAGGSADSASGPDMMVKTLIVACSVCLIVGILLGVICVCRTGKLVCVTQTIRRQTTEDFNSTSKDDESNQTVPPQPRQNTDQDYYNTVSHRYAVPDRRPVPPIRPSPRTTASDVGYVEPNHQRQQTECEQKENNYYFKLMPSSGVVTYESVAIIVEDKGSSRATASAETTDKLNHGLVNQNKELDKGLRFNTTTSNDNYDHLERTILGKNI